MRRCDRRVGPRWAVLIACLLLSALAVAGCSQPAAIAAPYPTWTPPPTWTPASSPTATVVVPSTANWQAYTDTKYRFKAVIPPGWRICAFVETRADSGGECAYDAIYFPPGDTRRAEPYVTMSMREYMAIRVDLGCGGADTSRLITDGRVTISGARADLYKNDGGGWVNRLAVAEFGGHPYYFSLDGTSATYQPLFEDVPLFMGVLSGFQYLGA